MTENAWGKKLWDYRKNLGVSRKKFAEMLDINEGTLRSYETEQRKPGYETYKKIEEYINRRDEVKESELSMNQQNMLIELQAEKIKYLEKKLESTNAIEPVKPAYHFKLMSTYISETETWLNPKIIGDVSMTGYTLNELHTLCDNNGSHDCFWINQYHPDSLIRLDAVQLSKIKTDYHYLKWEHMMWKSKNGKYECYNIDQVYSAADQEVTAMFCWVNGNED